MISLELSRIFVKVAQNASFTKAAKLLKIPKSTVSKAITRMEKDTGTKLFLRTTRNITLTAAGRAFYDSILGPIQTIEEAEKSLYGQDSIVSGLVKITAPEDIGSAIIAPAMAELTRAHPALSFELHYTDEVIDLVKDGFDLAIRLGKLNESSFKVKKLGFNVLVLVASSNYLKNHTKIQHPQDLKNHSCLSLSGHTLNNQWRLSTGKETSNVSISPKIISNQMSSLLAAAKANGGIALVPSFLCHADLKAGIIERVLPNWEGPKFPVSIISPLTTRTTARLKMTIDKIQNEIMKVL